MIRLVVAALLAVALVAVALPVVEQTARDRSDAEVRAGVDEVDGTATRLARTDETVPGTDGARRTVSVDLPASDVVAAGVRHLAIDPDEDAYRYRVEGASERSVQSSVPLETASGESLELTDPGTHRLVLSLADIDGERRIVVERYDAVARDRMR